jgi:hypothetical protein
MELTAKVVSPECVAANRASVLSRWIASVFSLPTNCASACGIGLSVKGMILPSRSRGAYCSLASSAEMVGDRIGGAYPGAGPFGVMVNGVASMAPPVAVIAATPRWKGVAPSSSPRAAAPLNGSVI